MKTDEVLQTFYEYSKKASDIARQLSFAGIAVIWIFRTGTPSVPKISIELLIPSVFFVLTLTFDLFQYISATFIWHFYHRYLEEKGLKDCLPSVWLNRPIFYLFVVKLCFAVLGYIFLLAFLFKKMFIL